MDILKHNIYKISILLLIISIPSVLAGQSESGDSTSSIFVSEDTVISENILKTPELQVKKTPESISASPVIPMLIPGMKHPDLMMSPKYLGYESAKNMFRYTTPRYDPWQLNLNLNIPPQKSFLDLIKENPFMSLLYGVATLAGMANNNIKGEDKMNMIRLNNMVQSRSGVPESAISGNGKIYYEIDIKRSKY
ncbi:MAG: hypothetical protein LBD76_02255 [Prevotellaceae bacterium]|jgi:hypothetical protein|nr:hypothetical protein [Prevotellaceae bacterium]